MFGDLSKYDVFNTCLLHGAQYAGDLEMPVLQGTDQVPNKLVPFSKAMARSFTDRDCWVCFYEHDIKFVRLWRHPEKYIDRLLEFRGIVSPDFSMYRNMPAVMQYWSCFMGRAIAHRCEADGGVVLPNVRLSDTRSFKYCLDGLPQGSGIAVGTHGCIKRGDDRRMMALCVAEIVERLTPKFIVVYGSAPDDVFESALEAGIGIVAFESQFSQTHKKAVRNGDR